MLVVLANSLVLFWPQRLRLTLAEFSRSLQLGRTAEPLMSHVPACTSKAFPTKDVRSLSATAAQELRRRNRPAGWLVRKKLLPVCEHVVQKTRFSRTVSNDATGAEKTLDLLHVL
jgi:hypothetical protein